MRVVLNYFASNFSELPKDTKIQIAINKYPPMEISPFVSNTYYIDDKYIDRVKNNNVHITFVTKDPNAAAKNVGKILLGIVMMIFLPFGFFSVSSGKQKRTANVPFGYAGEQDLVINVDDAFRVQYAYALPAPAPQPMQVEDSVFAELSSPAETIAENIVVEATDISAEETQKPQEIDTADTLAENALGQKTENDQF